MADPNADKINQAIPEVFRILNLPTVAAFDPPLSVKNANECEEESLRNDGGINTDGSGDDYLVIAYELNTSKVLNIPAAKQLSDSQVGKCKTVKALVELVAGVI